MYSHIRCNKKEEEKIKTEGNGKKQAKKSFSFFLMIFHKINVHSI